MSIVTNPRRMVILVDGYTDPNTAKTAVCVIRYRAEEVVAVLDRGGADKTSGELLGVGGSIPVVAALADAQSANTLLLGIAPPGGKIPVHWRQIVLEALSRRMTVISGLHEFLGDDAEFVAAAQHGGTLIDLRRNDERDVAHRSGLRKECLRIHTVANDCSCGKMVTSVEVALGLQKAGVDAAFVATGQTGILVAGGGCAIDRVISDFVAGAAERLILANQHHEVILLEGQGSLFHPRYSGVTLSLLHGAMPHGLIVCYELGRKAVYGMPDVPLPPLKKVIDYYEETANIMHPCRVIGVAVNGMKYSDAEVSAECARVEDEFQLPACDVIRQGPDKLVEAVQKMLQK